MTIHVQPGMRVVSVRNRNRRKRHSSGMVCAIVKRKGHAQSPHYLVSARHVLQNNYLYKKDKAAAICTMNGTKVATYFGKGRSITRGTQLHDWDVRFAEIDQHPNIIVSNTIYGTQHVLKTFSQPQPGNMGFIVKSNQGVMQAQCFGPSSRACCWVFEGQSFPGFSGAPWTSQEDTSIGLGMNIGLQRHDTHNRIWVLNLWKVFEELGLELV